MNNDELNLRVRITYLQIQRCAYRRDWTSRFTSFSQAQYNFNMLCTQTTCQFSSSVTQKLIMDSLSCLASSSATGLMVLCIIASRHWQKIINYVFLLKENLHVVPKVDLGGNKCILCDLFTWPTSCSLTFITLFHWHGVPSVIDVWGYDREFCSSSSTSIILFIF
jgi:hypothetical protein